MALSVLIIDCTGKAYNSANSAELALGGIERTIVQLAENFARKGLKVSVWNNTPAPVIANGVSWIPKDRPDMLAPYDIVIACNESQLFDAYAKASGHKNFRPYLWFHNRVLFEKTIRKGRMMPMLRWRPVGIFLGKDHKARTTSFLPLRDRIVIGHGIEEEILNHARINPVSARQPIAVFFSQPYRGLAGIISLWQKDIHPALPHAKLRIYASDLKDIYKNALSDTQLADAGIEIRGRMPRAQLLKELEDARVCLIPGHVDETFCLAAAEALAMHIPVLSYGTGALKERITHEKNGFIVQDEDDFVQKLKLVLTDDSLWRKLSEYGLQDENNYRWDVAADSWVRLFRDKYV